jgi:hypothetical protein
VNTVDAAAVFAMTSGLPLRLSSSYSLGWHETAINLEELRVHAQRGLELSPINEITLEIQEV